MIADVAVVGGGPAGAAAAITLARSGRDVVLVDKAPFPRDKCCGDGITTNALRRYRELGLKADDVASWHAMGRAVLVSPRGRQHILDVPPTVIARRADLDTAFLDVARGAGVKVYDGHALTGARVTDAAVALEVDGLGAVTAHYAVGADGMWSPLRKFVAAEPAGRYLGDWHAFRQYFHSVAPAAGDAMWVWFEPDVLPGYVWSFPLGDGRANLGFGILRRDDPTRTMGEQWRGLLERDHIARVLGPHAEPESPAKAWPIPARFERERLSAGAGRVLFAGDAARVADPMTGEGIGQALESGVEAAQAILRAGPADPAGAARRYAGTLARGVAADNALAALLSSVLAAPRRAEVALAVAAASGWTRRNFARWLFEDYPRAIVATPHRWPLPLPFSSFSCR